MRTSSLRQDAVPLIVLVVVLAIAYYAFFGQYAFDDSYFGYSIAQSLLLGHGFSFNGGDRVLSTSAPLAVPLYIIVSWVFRVSIVVAAQICSAASLAIVAFGSYSLARGFCSRAGALGAALTLTCTPFTLLLWSHETLLYAATTIAGLLLYARARTTASAIVLGAATLFRGEALLLLPLVWYAQLRSRGMREALRFAAISLAPYAAWALGATLYFGTPFSQTIASKHAQLRYANITPYLDGLRDYATRMYAITPTRAWVVLLEIATACAYLIALLCGMFRRVYVAVALWVLATTVLYVLLQLPFYFWFCVQLGVGMAASVAMLWPKRGEARFTLLHALGRVATVVIVAINVGFLLLQIAVPARKANSYDWIIMPAIHANAYRTLAAYMSRPPFAGGSIAYPEYGQLHYYSGSPIVDYLGVVTPGAAAHLARGNAIWTFKRYRPQFVIETSNFAYFVAPLEYDWFTKAYAAVARWHVGGDPMRSAFTLYRLRVPEAIPRPDERDARLAVRAIAQTAESLTFAFTPSQDGMAEIEARVAVPSACTANLQLSRGRSVLARKREPLRAARAIRLTMVFPQPFRRAAYVVRIGGCRGIALAPPVLPRTGFVWWGKPPPMRGKAADALTLYVAPASPAAGGALVSPRR